MKPPAPILDDDDDDGATPSVMSSRGSFNRQSVGSTFSMAGAAAISLRKSLRRDTGDQDKAEAAARKVAPLHSYTPEPEPEGGVGWMPRPPSGAKPAARAPRPGQQGIPIRRSQPTTSTGSSVPPLAAEPERISWGSNRPSWMGRFNAPVGWAGPSPVQPRPPEETAPAAPVAHDVDDEMRLSNFSVRSSNFNMSSRSKSTPSRARHKNATSTAQSTTDDHGEAGVIKKTLRPGRRRDERPPVSSMRSARATQQSPSDYEERDSHQSRATGTFTSRGTGTVDNASSFDGRETTTSRGTFNFADENPEDDDEAMLADPLAAF